MLHSTGRFKNTMNGQTQSTELLTALEAVDETLARIQKQEDEAIDRIFLRFCLLKGKEINYDHVKRVKNKSNPNLWSYYYKPGTIEEFFLLKRELIAEVKDEQPVYKLNIVFNSFLLKEE